MLAHAPIYRQVTPTHRGPVVIDFADQLVRGDAGRQGGEPLRQPAPLGHGNASLASIGPFFTNERRPVHCVLAFEVGQHWVYREFAGIHGRTVGSDHVITKFGTKPLRGKPVGIQAPGAGMLRYFFIHQRLRQGRGVLLVVAKFAKTDDVHHHIFAKFQAELQCQLGGQDHGLGIIAIDMQHWRFDHLDNVRAVQGGAAVTRVAGGKADLVVDHDMHCAAGGVATGLSQREGLHHHPLAGESRVAVNQHRQHLLAVRVAAAVHAGSYRTLNHRVDDFKMRRIESQGQVHRATRRGNV